MKKLLNLMEQFIGFFLLAIILGVFLGIAGTVAYKIIERFI